MFKVLKVTEIEIGDIRDIHVQKTLDLRELGYSQRYIIIATHAGEEYRITLQAPDEVNLDLKVEPESDEGWLKPKLYKGSKKHGRVNLPLYPALHGLVMGLASLAPTKE